MKRRKFNQPRTMGDALRSGSGSTSSNSVAPSVMSAPLHQPTRQYGQAPLPPPPPSSTRQYGQAPPPPPPRTMGDVLRSISGSTSSNSSSVAPSVISAPLHRSTRLFRSTQPPHPPPPPSPPPPPIPPAQGSAGRGHGRGILEWKSGLKVEVLFNSYFQPVGENASKLKSQLGKIVRDGYRIPLTILDWKCVDQEVKDDIWKEVQENVMDVPNGYKDVCMRSCNDLWKNHKSKTKIQYFEPRKYDPNLANDPPAHIVAEQWVDLVAYWRTDEAVNKSKLSSVARELHGPLHTTGRKHSAQLRLEMDQSGEPTDKMSVWIKARNKQDPDVIEVIEVFENHLLNEPEDQRSLAVVRDKIFHEIMGKDGHGYCRTFGSSVPRSLVYPKSSSSSSENTTDLLKMISEQLKQFGERLEKLEARVISNENNDRNTNEIVDGSSEADRRSFTGEEHNTNTPSPQKSAPEQD